MKGLPEIHARLQAADRALARVRGGSSELDLVRQAAGSLLVAVYELARLLEERESEAARPRGAKK